MSDSLRRAALVLSGLRERDRAWLLARLGDVDRDRLSALMAEVRGLGIAVDAPTLRELVRSEPAGVPEPETPRPALRPLATASASIMHGVLEREPDWAVAAVLRAGTWTWRGQFLELLGTERRLRVQRCQPSMAPRAAAIEALLAAVEGRVEDAPDAAVQAGASVPAATPPGLLGRLRYGLNAWRG